METTTDQDPKLGEIITGNSLDTLLLNKKDIRDTFVHFNQRTWIKLKAFVNTANISDSTQQYQQARVVFCIF